MFYVGLPQLATGTKTTLTKGGGAVDKQERKISIKINGQSKEEQAQEKDEFTWVLPEPSSKDSHVEENKVVFIEDVRNEKKKKPRLHPKNVSIKTVNGGVIKRTAVIVLLAVGIGSGIGMVGVKMMTGSEQPVSKAQTSEQTKEEKAAQTASTTESVGKAEKKSEQESKGTSAAASTLEPFSFYIVQAGAFSSKTAANKAMDKWKEENQAGEIFSPKTYSLVVGAATGEEKAEALSKTYKQQGKDVYVKSYEIKPTSELGKKDQTVITTAQPFMANLLDQSVKAIEGERVADIKSLKKELTKVQKEASNEDIKTMVSTLQKAAASLSSYEDNKSSKDAWLAQRYVLKALQQYESLVTS
ncbi:MULTISPECIES: SPOR domain-containing protein [Priestia]|jgi:stage II sporulation protein B|uniref:SPOR domain-containing protein n=1 Tax=Priestia TaxID=2800373 RepID=UPI000762AF74|nr:MULTISPECIES: SPOR domain-containing protein [Priestia]KWU64413.1 stage II sporulation protein B [Priestia megaterium]MBX9995043.1 SPOR domain-containing protein [Priestia aryabhattai]MCP1448826.1 stage II sporulation protein B [Priestia megaterium]MCU7736715.1 SPOR domain-containing protein [Priestia megaterium]MCU7742146.1 SPOR domain-containing protein [Priestia megaterium]